MRARPETQIDALAWSDLQWVLVIKREGTLRAAARALRLSHPTLSRRVAELQDALGVHLFERDGRRLRLTAAGEDLARTAARIEPEVDGLSRRITGRDHRLQGVVRVSLTPSALAALAPALADFNARYPGIELEFLTGLTLANLTRREADIALRFTLDPPETLVGRKLSVFQQAVYASQQLTTYLRTQGDDQPESWPWIDWDEAHRHHSSARWVNEHLPNARVVARCESSMSMYLLVKAGVGVGFVPQMLAARDEELVPMQGQLPVFNRDIWVLTHEDLRTTGRIRVALEWLHTLLYVPDSGVWLGPPHL